jgi:hypothetical protein
MLSNPSWHPPELLLRSPVLVLVHMDASADGCWYASPSAPCQIIRFQAGPVQDVSASAAATASVLGCCTAPNALEGVLHTATISFQLLAPCCCPSQTPILGNQAQGKLSAGTAPKQYKHR